MFKFTVSYSIALGVCRANPFARNSFKKQLGGSSLNSFHTTDQQMSVSKSKPRDWTVTPRGITNGSVLKRKQSRRVLQTIYFVVFSFTIYLKLYIMEETVFKSNDLGCSAFFTPHFKSCSL